MLFLLCTSLLASDAPQHSVLYESQDVANTARSVLTCTGLSDVTRAPLGTGEQIARVTRGTEPHATSLAAKLARAWRFS